MSTEITVSQASERLKISSQRVRTLCRQGQVAARKVGTNWLIDSNSLTRHGLTTSHQIAEDHPTYSRGARTQKVMPVALSFFSGAMGLDLGVERAGFDIRLACEFDKFCRQTISLNKPDTALIGDINEYRPDEILEFAGLSRNDDIDLIFGGPPCQAFSTAGKRNGFNDDRGNAFITYLDIALDLRPKFIVIENVRGLLSCPMSHRPHDRRGGNFPELGLDELPGGALNFILSMVHQAGYAYSFNLYNSANFGTPQVRERVVIICSRDGNKPPYLQPTHSECGTDGLKNWKTFRQVTKGIHDHHHLTFPEKRLHYYRMLKSGQNWRCLPEKLQQEALGKSFFAGGGKTGFLRRVAWDKPTPTLVTHPAMPATDLAHPEKLRPLSIEEYKRVQEFPDDWQLAGPLVQQYKQVGNAVPGSLGYAIGLLVLNLLKSKEVRNPANFCYSRYRNTDEIAWMKDFVSRSKALKEARQEELF
jgi:DNA (cytosine-5)-methyltransferase 1